MTNPIDVIKVRMQLESELLEQSGLSHLQNRYYDGWVKGSKTILHDEGIRGLYKGYGNNLPTYIVMFCLMNAMLAAKQLN